MSWRDKLDQEEQDVVNDIVDHLLIGRSSKYDYPHLIQRTILHLSYLLDETELPRTKDLSPDRYVTRMDVDGMLNVERGRIMRLFAYELCDAIKKAFNVP